MRGKKSIEDYHIQLGQQNDKSATSNIRDLKGKLLWHWEVKRTGRKYLRSCNYRLTFCIICIGNNETWRIVRNSVSKVQRAIFFPLNKCTVSHQRESSLSEHEARLHSPQMTVHKWPVCLYVKSFHWPVNHPVSPSL